MLATIHLHGRLGKMFGREWRFDVDTVAEALAQIMRARKGFFDFLYDSENSGVVFRVLDKKGRALGSSEELQINNTDELHIYPVVSGSKRQGLMQTIIGVVLIIVAVVIMVYAPYGGQGATAMAKLGSAMAAGSYGAMATYALLMIGISMTIGGIVQMATPMPKLGSSAADKNASNIFDGSSLASRQGVAIPILYGKMHLQGMLVSAGVYSDAMAMTGYSGGYFGSDIGGDEPSGALIPGSSDTYSVIDNWHNNQTYGNWPSQYPMYTGGTWFSGVGPANPYNIG